MDFDWRISRTYADIRMRLFVLIVRRSGVARQLVTFFVSPKKVTQKRRPRCHWPSASQLCESKNGKASKLASLKQRSFLDPFSASHNWQCQKWMKVKSKSKTFTAARNINGRRACMCSLLSHVATPIVLGKNGVKESQMFERSEFLTLPHF